MSQARDNAARKLGYESQAERERIRRLFAKHNLTWERGQKRPTPANLKRIAAGLSPRNYKVEEQRRNERAKAKGFTSRGQQRKFKKAVTTERYHPVMRKLAENPELAGFYPRTYMTMYSPEKAQAAGIPLDEYTKAYYFAFLAGPERYALARKHGSAALKHWFVDIAGVYTEAEYDEKYH